MSNTELTVLNNEETLQDTDSVDFNSKFMQLKPATVSIVQPQSTLEGATKGNFRISGSGEEFSELFCAFLDMPSEMRNYHIGEPGELSRIPANLLCFSTDMKKPHEKAKVPQSMLCANCSKADWEPYRAWKEKHGKANKALIPRCDAQIVAYMIDTVFQLPIRMYFRSKAKSYFEQGMENVARTLWMSRAKNEKTQIYNVKFKMTTKLIQDGSYKYYVPIISEPKVISESEKTEFGALYLAFHKSKNQNKLLEAENKVITEVQTGIDSVVEGEYVGPDQEITI